MDPVSTQIHWGHAQHSKSAKEQAQAKFGGEEDDDQDWLLRDFYSWWIN